MKDGRFWRTNRSKAISRGIRGETAKDLMADGKGSQNRFENGFEGQEGGYYCALVELGVGAGCWCFPRL